MEFLSLQKITAYNTAYELSNQIWTIIIQWDYFSKDTLGKQYVRSVDSISANIAEEFGRYYKKEKIRFYRYSLGSLQESIDWTQKAIERNLLNFDQSEHVLTTLEMLPKEINHLIKYTNEKLIY